VSSVNFGEPGAPRFVVMMMTPFRAARTVDRGGRGILRISMDAMSFALIVASGLAARSQWHRDRRRWAARVWIVLDGESIDDVQRLVAAGHRGAARMRMKCHRPVRWMRC